MDSVINIDAHVIRVFTAIATRPSTVGHPYNHCFQRALISLSTIPNITALLATRAFVVTVSDTMTANRTDYVVLRTPSITFIKCMPFGIYS